MFINFIEYSHTLKSKLQDKFSGYWENIVVLLQDCKANRLSVSNDVEDLYQAGQKIWGTNENK